MSSLLSAALVDAAQRVLTRFRGAGLTLCAAESCTGGLVAACLTEIAGSSEVFERGFVTYSNQSKIDLLGVPAQLLDEHGAVSEPVARAMVDGALARSTADIAVSVTGVAGPGGGSPDKPVGLVHIAAARRGAPGRVERHQFHGDRAAIREAAVLAAFSLALSLTPA